MSFPIKLYVNDIIETGKSGLYGLEYDMVRIFKNMDIIIQPSDKESVLMEARDSPTAISFVHRFCQFIFYLKLNNDLTKGNLVFFDCKNEMDIALDVYNAFSKGEFKELQKEDFMEMFLQISKDYDNLDGMAELTVEEI